MPKEEVNENTAAKLRFLDWLLTGMMAILTAYGVWVGSTLVDQGKAQAAIEAKDGEQDKTIANQGEALKKLSEEQLSEADLANLKMDILDKMQEPPRWIVERLDTVIEEQRELKQEIREMKQKLDQ